LTPAVQKENQFKPFSHAATQPKKSLEKILGTLGFRRTVEEHQLGDDLMLDVKTDGIRSLDRPAEGQTLADLQYLVNRILFQQDQSAPEGDARRGRLPLAGPRRCSSRKPKTPPRRSAAGAMPWSWSR
jgi:hypothetical protein